MAPRRAEDRTRYAVVGAQSPSGGRLRAALAELGVPGERVALYGIASEEAVVSEYDGEARLVQAVDADLVGAADVVLHCLPDPIPSLTGLPRIRARLVDLEGVVPGGSLACDSLLPVPSEGPWRIPHGISVALAGLVAPLAALGAERAFATVLRPAADFGEAGLEELREQTVRLLRFEGPPTEIFGRQLAFNAIAQPFLPEGKGFDRRVAGEASRLTGARVSVAHVAIPVFHGHVVVLHAAGVRGGPEAAREALQALDAPKDGPVTPFDLSEEPAVRVARVEGEDDEVRILALVAEAGASAARAALRLASVVAGS